MFIPRQTHNTVSFAKVPTWTTNTAAFCRSHKQRLTLLTMFTLEIRQNESVLTNIRKMTSCNLIYFLNTYYGVIMALQTNVWLIHTSAVAMFVAAALRGAVVSNKTEVTLAYSRGHTCSIHTALCTHWLTLTRNTKQKKGSG